MKNKKYILLNTDTVVNEFGVTLKRIKYLKDGTLGGYLEKESNLSQDGDAQVSGNARVSGDARVYGNARVYGDTQVYGNARVYGDAQVYGNAWVYGDADIFHALGCLKYPVTITPQNISIGCQLWDRFAAKGSRCLDTAVDAHGLTPEEHKAFRSVVKLGIRLVPRRRAEKSPGDTK